jgi:5-methylcytosine-specific restriction endonuclease McrA
MLSVEARLASQAKRRNRSRVRYQNTKAEKAARRIQKNVEDAKHRMRTYTPEQKARKSFVSHEAAIKRSRVNKAHFIREMGGRCVRCGFNEHPWGLEFDHVDPTTKMANPGRILSWKSQYAIKRELDKCQLICSNCHKLKTMAFGPGGRTGNHPTTEESRKCALEIWTKDPYY